MSIRMWEEIATQQTGIRSATRNYYVELKSESNTSTEMALSHARKRVADLRSRGLTLDTLNAQEITTRKSGAAIVYGLYKVEAGYSDSEDLALPIDPLDPGGPGGPEAGEGPNPQGARRQPPSPSAQQPGNDFIRTSSSASVQNIRLRVSRGVVAAYVPDGAVAVDNKGLMGVDEDGVPQGVDIPYPKAVASVTKIVEAMNAATEATMQGIVGCINNAAYRGRPIGTLLCTGVSITQQSDTRWEVSAVFEYSPNEAGIVIGDIAVASKYGWQYLDVQYAKKKDAAGRSVAVPVQATVHNVFPDANFASALGF